MSQRREGSVKHTTVGDQDKGQEGLRSVSSSVTEIDQRVEKEVKQRTVKKLRREKQQRDAIQFLNRKRRGRQRSRWRAVYPQGGEKGEELAEEDWGGLSRERQGPLHRK